MLVCPGLPLRYTRLRCLLLHCIHLLWDQAAQAVSWEEERQLRRALRVDGLLAQARVRKPACTGLILWAPRFHTVPQSTLHPGKGRESPVDGQNDAGDEA